MILAPRLWCSIRRWEGIMNRRSVLSVSAVMALAAAVMPSSVVAQEKSLKDQLVGTWIFVSAQDVKPDGTKVDPWGPNPVCRQSISDSWLGNLRECLAHLV